MRTRPAPPSDLIRSVARALSILEVVGQDPDGLTVKAIARRSDLGMAAARHLINTLLYGGFMARWDPGYYTLGPAVLTRAGEVAIQLDRRIGSDLPPERMAEALRLNPVELCPVLKRVAALTVPVSQSCPVHETQRSSPLARRVGRTRA